MLHTPTSLSTFDPFGEDTLDIGDFGCSDEPEIFVDAVTPSGVRMRPYQIDGIREVEAGWSKAKRQLLVMATGTGKTVVMSELARRRVQRKQRTLMLAHSDELIDQARDKFAANGVGSGKEKADEYASRHDLVVCASVQTLCRPSRLESFAPDHFHQVMVDETHRIAAASYQVIIDRFCKQGGADQLGVTATASRADKKALSDFFDRIAFDYPLVKAVHDGWLVRPLVRTVPLKIDISKVHTKGGDLDSRELSHAIEPFLVQIAQHIKVEAPQRKIILFLPSVETSAKMAEALRNVGFKADYVSGACTDRNEKVRAFKRGEIQCLCNAQLLTEGFDYDGIDCVVCLRPTKVHGLYMQIIGRGTRPLGTIASSLNEAPDAAARQKIIAGSAKPHLLILDFLWLYEKHDLLRPASLINPDPEVAKRMKGDGDIVTLTERAERDALAALKKAAEANRHRESKLIDPLLLSARLGIGDGSLAGYTPKTLWDASEISPTTRAELVKAGFNPNTLRNEGQAGEVMKLVRERKARGLCSIRQMNWLKRYGIDGTNLTYFQAWKEQTTVINRLRSGGR